jgi:uncharacterized protein
MNAVALRFYVHQPRRHGKIQLYEWLLEQGKSLGVHGGSAFFATAGYGRHGGRTQQFSGQKELLVNREGAA